MKVSQISKSDTLSQMVVQQMSLYATILAFAEFYKMVGNSDNVRKVSAAAGGQFRDLNADYPANQINPAYDTPVLKILGDKVQVDRAYERRGLDLPSVRERDLRSFAQTLGMQFQKYFVNGDSATPVQFDGIKKIMPAGQVVAAAANGLDVVTGNSDAAKKAQQAFVEKLLELCGKIRGGAMVLMADALTIARLSSIARDQGQWLINEFGKPVFIFNGIPIVESGYDKDGAKIIPHTEVKGTSGAVCTSVYAMRFGEGANLSLATNVGIEVIDKGLVGAHYEHHVDFDVDTALVDDKSIARLEGVIIS